MSKGEMQAIYGKLANLTNYKRIILIKLTSSSR